MIYSLAKEGHHGAVLAGCGAASMVIRGLGDHRPVTWYTRKISLGDDCEAAVSTRVME